MTTPSVDTFVRARDRWSDLGASPEDPEPGAEEGASGTQAASDKSARSLAARVDSALAAEDEAESNGAEPDDDRDAGETMLDASVPIDMEDVQELTPPPQATPIPPPPKIPTMRGAPPPPIPTMRRDVVVVPPRPPAVKVPSGVIARIPIARVSAPIAVPAAPQSGPVPTISVPPRESEEESNSGPVRTRQPTPAPPVPVAVITRESSRPRGLVPPQRDTPSREISFDDGLDMPAAGDLSEGGVEVGTETPNIVVDQPLEAHLESPTVVDRAIEDLSDAGMEKRAAQMVAQLDATSDPSAAAVLAYELGELYERRLADEARAVKAFGRSLTLDPSLRPNLWAIRRVFYRRGLWPNLVKLIAAEVTYARDDYERADLLLEKARISARINEHDEAKTALEEAVRIAPSHQAALLEYERVVARANDATALTEAWELLAEAVEQPARKVSYLLEIGRAAAVADFDRARSAFDRAAALAQNIDRMTAERVARERLRLAEEHGTREDAAAAIESLSTILLATFGPAGPSDGEMPDRAQHIRRELIALRRRQSQLARDGAPERAWELLQQALAMAPGDPVLLNDLTELAEELGRYSELAELVQSWQAVEGDEGRAMVLSIRRADALLRGGQRDQARALLASLEASAPGFIVLTSASERDALGRADPADLAKAYLSAAHAALLGSWLGPGQPPAPDPGAAAALYVQAAELLAYEVAQSDAPEAATALDEARAALGKALEAVPSYQPAHESLTELDDATGNIEQGLGRLKATAFAAEGESARGHFERAIRFARAHGDLDSVLELEQGLVKLAPSELTLKWRLESTLSQLGRDDERAQLLTEIAADERDTTTRGTALLGAARLRERGGAVEQATDLYRQVLAVWPEDTFSRESLVDLLRAQERWAELVTERRAEARALPDGESARRALREAAWVLEIKLADYAQAAQVYDDWLSRLPDDRTALEGIARCRGQFGDRLGEAAARRTIAELEPTAETQWLLARALEHAGQFDDAADVFRALAVREEVSVAATSAALALADIAAGRADGVMRVEATAALAGRTTDARLGAALAEDSGWMYALVLEDFDRAAQSFEAAIALEPSRRGALLGAALVAARRGDQAPLSAAYGGLAAAVAMPEAAAALHLRAAAMAAAAGDLDLANQRVANARTSAPDDTSALLVVAETAALPTISRDTPSGEDTEAAVDALLARAEVLEMRGALADDPIARASWELDRAEALELAGRLREAAMVVAAVLKAHPGDVRALEAARRMAKRAHDDVAWAQASYQLARVIGDPQAKLALLRDAASILDDEKNPATTDRALAIYKRILLVDPGAEELGRMLDLYRARADVAGLIRALTDRLTWLEAENQDLHRDAQMVPLLLERATVLHGLGDGAAAMADLDALLDRNQSHLEALRFRADLAFNAGEVNDAVSLWRRYLQAENRPQRRQEIELRLAQVLAENVQDIAGAIENMEHVIEANGEDIGLREQMLGLCLRASDWDRATRELRVLARLRPTPQEKARDELRLGLMLRDRTGDRVAARMALDRARSFDPLNLDVVRELAELVDPNTRNQVLSSTASSFRASIIQNPRGAVLYDRLAQVTAWQSDVDARWLALVGLEALGTPSVDQRQVLEAGRAAVHGSGVPPKAKLDDESRRAIRGGATGALVELWRAIGPAVQVATGVDAGKLGFVRGDKIAQKKLGEKYEPLATALGAFAVDNVEIYVSAARGGIARVLAADTPVLCIGADVAAAKTPHQRWLLGRAVATLAEGLGTLPDLRDVELGWTIAAALRAADLAIPQGLADEVQGEDASIAERTKILKKELSRKAKGVLVQLVNQRGAELVDIAGFRRMALDVGNRAGLLWAGDLAVALAMLDVGKGGKALTDSPSALELVGWWVSEEHERLRDKIGVALKGVAR